MTAKRLLPTSHIPRLIARAMAIFTALVGLLHTGVAGAVPSFARQTGMACASCHTVFPELTHFGRMFKAGGYVIDNLKQVKDVSLERRENLSLSDLPPLSLMIQVSDTQLAKPLPDTAKAGGSAQNGTVAFPQQVSIFYAGKIAPHVGAFLQLTYANDSGTIGIDNVDLRYADMRVLPNDQSLVYGVSLNNNPTVQDLWNSTPAFGFPFVSSNSALGIPYATQIDGSRGQDVAGISAYVFWKESVYAELGVYRSAKQGTAGPLDSTSAGGVLATPAPYWRVAYETNQGPHSLMLGTYGMSFQLYPDLAGCPSCNPPTTTGFGNLLGGPSDRFRDVAFDLQYQFLSEPHTASVMATHIHETQTLNASVLAGAAQRLDNTLTTSRVTATYYYKRQMGGSLNAFSTTGTQDDLYIATTTHAPDTRGVTAELSYLPWLNTKISLQYTAYTKYAGLKQNYDGLGRNANDNNSLYVVAWLAY